jgi:hypothetical protein
VVAAVLPVAVILAAVEYQDHPAEVAVVAAVVVAAAVFQAVAVAGQDVVVKNNFIKKLHCSPPNREDFFYALIQTKIERFIISFNTPIRLPCNLNPSSVDVSLILKDFKMITFPNCDQLPWMRKSGKIYLIILRMMPPSLFL